VPFDLGLAIGLGAVVLVQRRRYRGAVVLSVLCSLASPVAGAFLALAFVAWGLAGPRRAGPLALALLTLAPIALLSVVFPEGGTQPFVASAFYPALAGVLVVGAAVSFKYPALRIGAALYAAALIGSYVLATAVGGNADRLGALLAGPIAACVLAGTLSRRRARLLVVLAPALLYWQANAPFADFAAAVGNPAVEASYYAPLLGELRALGIGYGQRPARIEVVSTVVHWEARWVAPQTMIARGWERQLDRYRNGLFYAERAPTPGEYRAWLGREAVSYVALPDTTLDYSAVAEARIVSAAGGSFLSEVWRSRHWRLFAVRDPVALAVSPGRLVQADTESFTLFAPAPGRYTVRIHFTSYWALGTRHGCVARAPGDWTYVVARRAGLQHVVIRFALDRVFSRGPRCS
jgi:hypothetical protein